ncbi:hypothetical protein GCM10025771_38730 [Niveibacterium umoris]
MAATSWRKARAALIGVLALQTLPICAVVRAESPAVSLVEAPGQWKSGPWTLIERDASDGWVTLRCEGPPECNEALLAAAARWPEAQQRLEQGALSVRADYWRREVFPYFGAFRAVEPTADLALPSRIWLDDRYAGLRCSWRDAAGAHTADLSGGDRARYSGPDSASSEMVLISAKACSRCRAHYLHLQLKGSGEGAAPALFLNWSGVEFLPIEGALMQGFASLGGKAPVRMRCTGR